MIKTFTEYFCDWCQKKVKDVVYLQLQRRGDLTILSQDDICDDCREAYKQFRIARVHIYGATGK